MQSYTSSRDFAADNHNPQTILEIFPSCRLVIILNQGKNNMRLMKKEQILLRLRIFIAETIL